jgi:hypothetical protein
MTPNAVLITWMFALVLPALMLAPAAMLLA